MDKYLNTKQGSLEESVLEIWKEAAIEEDFRMDGRTKAYKEHRARLEAARLRKEGIKKSIQTEDDDPHADSAKSGGKEEYKKFFNAAMKKFGVSSPAELKGDKEKEFYNYIDKNWKGDHEEELEENAAVELQKKVAKGGMDKQMFQKSVDLLKSKKYDELKKHLKASDTAPREYVMSLIAKKEPATFKKMYGNQTGYYSLMNQNEELEDSPNAANSQHLCAKNVVHEEWGDGECIPTMHAEPDEEGNIGWYDVMFEHGLEKGVAINELKVTHSEMHHNHKKKDKVKEDVVDNLAKAGAKAVGRGMISVAKKAGQKAMDKTGVTKAISVGKKVKDTASKVGARIKKAAQTGEEFGESYEMGTDEYRKHTQSITPGQDVTDFQNFKVESMREALAKVWGKAGDELEEYITKEGMRKRVAEGDKRRTENKDTGKGGKTMTGKTSDVINLKPTTEEVELDEAMSKDMALKILSMAKNQDFKIASGDRAPMIYLSNDDRDELKKEFGRLGRDVPGPNKGATVMQIVNLAHSGNDRKPFDTEGGKHMISWDKGGKKIGTPKKVSDAAKLAGLKLEEVELDEVAPLVGMAAKALAKGALAAVGSKVAKKAMGEKMLAADYMIKSGKSPEEIANVANVDVEEVKKVMAAYHEDDEKHYKEYLAAMCNGVDASYEG